MPDEKTIWAFREALTTQGIVEEVFAQFTNFLEHKGLIMNQGKMIDAIFTIAPRQRNTREENEQIKSGQGKELWKDKPNKKKHKDIDARWTKKNGRNFTVIKTTPKPIQNQNSLIVMWLQALTFTIGYAEPLR